MAVVLAAGRTRAGWKAASARAYPAPFNSWIGLAFVCPVTSRVKGYPFEVALRGVAGVSGVVLVDQLRSLDWRARRAKPAGRVPVSVMTEVVAKLRPLLGA